MAAALPRPRREGRRGTLEPHEALPGTVVRVSRHETRRTEFTGMWGTIEKMVETPPRDHPGGPPGEAGSKEGVRVLALGPAYRSAAATSSGAHWASR